MVSPASRTPGRFRLTVIRHQQIITASYPTFSPTSTANFTVLSIFLPANRGFYSSLHTSHCPSHSPNVKIADKADPYFFSRFSNNYFLAEPRFYPGWERWECIRACVQDQCVCLCIKKERKKERKEKKERRREKHTSAKV